MRKRSRLVHALVVTGIAITWFIVTFWGTTTSNENFSESIITEIYPAYDDDTAFGGVFANPAPVNDSLPHYLYQHLADSLKQLIKERQLENNVVSMEGGWGFGSVGMYTLQTPITSLAEKLREKHLTDRLDSLTIAATHKIATLTNEDSIKRIKDQLHDTTAYFNRLLNQRVPISPDHLHYLSLQGYSLPERTKFFVQNGTYNLAYLKVDSVKKWRNVTRRYCHYERKQIPVRYSAENKMLFIPVSTKLYKVLSIAGPVVSCFLIVAGYFFLAFSLQILINISRGNAFDDKNVRRLNIMALILLIVTVGSILLPYIFRLCFSKMIPNDFIFPGIWSKVSDKTGAFIVVVVIFITGKAFQKGNKLQKEQDLTI